MANIERHESVSEHTARELRRVIKNINPKHVDMDTWFDDKKAPRRPVRLKTLYRKLKDTNDCNTVACLAGWTCALNDVTLGYDISTIPSYYGAQADAARILKLDPRQEQRLFFVNAGWGGGWPEHFQDQYDKAKTSTQKYEVLKRRVNYFIRTGE